METLYYEDLGNGYIGMYTNSQKIAEMNGWTGVTNEEIVPQGDGSGNVLASQYVYPLANLKADKIAELKAIRDEKEVEDIETPYGTFDYDDKARERINAAIIALDVQGEDASISWTLADNSEAPVTAAILKNVIALVAQRSNALHVKYRQLADTVNACRKDTTVKAVVWE